MLEMNGVEPLRFPNDSVDSEKLLGMESVSRAVSAAVEMEARGGGESWTVEEERREEPVMEVEERREEPVEVVEERGSGVRSKVLSKESKRSERKRSLTEGDEIIDSYWKKFKKVREVGDLEVEIVTSSNSLDGGLQPGELRSGIQ